MKLKQILENIESYRKSYPDIDEWDVFIEDEDLYTISQKFIQRNGCPQELIEHNQKTINKIKEETKGGWKFLQLEDFMATKDEKDAYVYFKECAGGIGIVPEKKAVTIHINY